jgi:hypothetical protein
MKVFFVFFEVQQFGRILKSFANNVHDKIHQIVIKEISQNIFE